MSAPPNSVTTTASIAPTLLSANHKGNAKPMRKGQQATAQARQAQPNMTRHNK